MSNTETTMWENWGSRHPKRKRGQLVAAGLVEPRSRQRWENGHWVKADDRRSRAA